MRILWIQAWQELFSVEWAIKYGGVWAVNRKVREMKIRSSISRPRLTITEICRAIDIACVFYFKRVFCLQRSAATTILLKKYGFNAEMVIGAKAIPFRSHAWVEIDGRVVNDKEYIADLYRVLQRC